VPVHFLFAAFTNAEALKIWWWPKGLHSDHIDYEFKQGGRYFINMKGYDEGGGGMTGEFLEIVPDKKIVMTDFFSDKNGNPISAAEAKQKGNWPEVIYITFEFEALGENQSRFKLSQEGIPNVLQKDCMQGWNESFDKLQSYLISHEKDKLN
jgi:uncharacterized protein YndB with AHSA1/START domain